MHIILKGDNTHHYAYFLAKNRRTKILDINDDRSIHAIRNTLKSFSSQKTYYRKAIIIFNSETLQEDSQASLRRIMEHFANSVMFIFCCQSLHALSDAIQSRCSLVSFPTYTNASICENIPIDDIVNCIENKNIFDLYEKIKNSIKLGYRGDCILSLLVEKYPNLAPYASKADRSMLDGSNDTLQIYNALIQSLFYGEYITDKGKLCNLL